MAFDADRLDIWITSPSGIQRRFRVNVPLACKTSSRKTAYQRPHFSTRLPRWNLLRGTEITPWLTREGVTVRESSTAAAFGGVSYTRAYSSFLRNVESIPKRRYALCFMSRQHLANASSSWVPRASRPNAPGIRTCRPARRRPQEQSRGCYFRPVARRSSGPNRETWLRHSDGLPW